LPQKYRFNPGRFAKVSTLPFDTQGYTGCHKYVPIDQRLNFRAHRGYNLKRSTARCAKIKELDLATLGTQTASIFTLRFAKNA